MNTISKSYYPISRVLIYKGHELHSTHLGPYKENIIKRIGMFNELNDYRTAQGKRPWTVATVAGEKLIDQLKENSKETLLVIPAGQSSHLDKVFSIAETTFLKEEFFQKGGRGYFNCGSAYWVCQTRLYNDLHEEQPEKRILVKKTTHLPLFLGEAHGPLCPFPARKYQVGFFSDAVTVDDGVRPCTILLSGGGSFILPFQTGKKQKVKVLARYLSSELERLGKKSEEHKQWENAAIMVAIGTGAALLSMFHPYYSSRDICLERYEKAFPFAECGTNWQRVYEKLSSSEERMRFALRLLDQLEHQSFDKT